MDVLHAEVQKLSALVKARGKTALSVADVEEVASSTPECDAFALSNAVTDRNKAKAFLALEEMKLRRTDPAIIMGMLSKVYGDLLSVSMLMEEGCGQADIEKLLKINSYKLKIYMNASKKFKTDELCRTVKDLARADMNSKFGGVTGYTAVELFISQNI
jgi:DNA polymerase-3 subunit delta